MSKDLILEMSKGYNKPEIKLLNSIHEAPGIQKLIKLKEKEYIAFIKCAILNHLKDDNVVYHSLAGHFFVKDVPHALKVRVLVDMENRVRLEIERKGIDAYEARRILEKDDKERHEWSQNVYGIDIADPSLYDLVVHIKQLTVEDAVDIICNCVSKEQFKTTPESQRMIQDLFLSATIHRALIDVWTDITVYVDKHIAFIEIKAPETAKKRLVKQIREVTETFEGISGVKIKCHSIIPLSD